MSAPKFSIVIPFYNEEDNIGPLFAELFPVLDDMGEGDTFEIVCVNDGSSDGTEAALGSARATRKEIRVLTFPTNHGQTAAFEAGFRAARGAFIITMDGDLQIDPTDIPKMVAFREQQDVDFVFGWRKERRDSFTKRISTKIANTVRNWLTRETIPDTGCPLKVFRADVLKRMKLFRGLP